jgi:hypothetical protein
MRGKVYKKEVKREKERDRGEGRERDRDRVLYWCNNCTPTNWITWMKWKNS